MVKNPFSVYNSKFGKKKAETSLSWEESLGDASKPEDYYEGHGKLPNILLYLAATFLIFGSLILRLGNLQILNGTHYRKLADINHVRVQEILAPRGIVFDSQGQPLVQNVPSFELVVTPMDLPAASKDAEIQSLAKIINFDADALQAALAAKSPDSFEPITVVQSLDHDTAVMFESRLGDFPGFSIENNPIRQYQDAQIFSHLLGYTGKISSAELALHQNDNYLSNDYIGKTGLEYSYEQYLRGAPGQNQVEIDAQGNVKSVLGQIAPTPGNNIFLNIDVGLQRELYKSIVAHNGNKKAAAVALDPQTGQVLALLSLPGFDNNLFAKGISTADFSQLVNDRQQPLLNRAISGTYPPGSTIKSVMASAALQENVVDENTKIYDNGDLVVGNFHFHGWKPGGLGAMDMRSAIAWSSDIYFYTVGGGQQSLGIQGLGPERIAKYDHLFGMGQKLGIDLQGEATGLIGSPEERKARIQNPKLSGWYLGDTYHISIGQGDMAVTPLQDAEWTAVVANGGTLYRPYVVNKVLDESGKVLLQNQPQIINSGFIDPKNIEIVREGMRQTVLSGTAQILKTLPISAAGKTGTAQFDSADPAAAHAWFSAFAPYENPQIVVTVLIEAGGEGSSASAPVVRDVLDWWAKNRYLNKASAATSQ
jgi:penicillin-binding protein 2